MRAAASPATWAGPSTTTASGAEAQQQALQPRLLAHRQGDPAAPALALLDPLGRVLLEHPAGPWGQLEDHPRVVGAGGEDVAGRHLLGRLEGHVEQAGGADPVEPEASLTDGPVAPPGEVPLAGGGEHVPRLHRPHRALVATVGVVVDLHLAGARHALPQDGEDVLGDGAEDDLERAGGVDAEHGGDLVQRPRQGAAGVGAGDGLERGTGCHEGEALLGGEAQRPLEVVGQLDPHPAVDDVDLHEHVGGEGVHAAQEDGVQLLEQVLLADVEALAHLGEGRAVVGDHPGDEGEQPPQPVGGAGTGDRHHATWARSQDTTSWRRAGGSTTSAWSSRPRTQERKASALRTWTATSMAPSAAGGEHRALTEVAPHPRRLVGVDAHHGGDDLPVLPPDLPGVGGVGPADLGPLEAAGGADDDLALDPVEAELAELAAGVVVALDVPATPGEGEAVRVDRAALTAVAEGRRCPLGDRREQRGQLGRGGQLGDGCRRRVTGGTPQLPEGAGAGHAVDPHGDGGEVQRGHLVRLEPRVTQGVALGCDPVAVHRRVGPGDGRDLEGDAHVPEHLLVALEGPAERRLVGRVPGDALGQLARRQRPRGGEEGGGEVQQPLQLRHPGERTGGARAVRGARPPPSPPHRRRRRPPGRRRDHGPWW
jgi:hypothetical protein